MSDTATRPTPAMRTAMANAPVGDEQRGEDPSVNHLCGRVAELLGKEAALFLPSGIMCNQIAIAVHCRPGDEIIVAHDSHIIRSEGAGAAAFTGAFVTPIAAHRGIFTGDEVEAVLRPRQPRSPQSRMVAVEQTSNRGGGSVWPLDAIHSLAQVTRTHELKLHMDGARLMNAVVASGVSAACFAQPFDSVWLGFTKGLGCPVGAVLVGDAAFIEAAWRWKHRLGGAMRQAGILAAACLYALDHHVDRLTEDHENARSFAQQLLEFPGITLNSRDVQTNLVFFDVEGTGFSALRIAERLLERGIRLGVESEFRLRAVTHLDIDRAAIEETVDAMFEAVAVRRADTLARARVGRH